MRIQASLGLLAALAGCAHIPENDVQIRRMLQDELSPQQACIALPSGDSMSRSDDRVSLSGRGPPGGPYAYEEKVRAGFDAFAAIGFLSVEEQVSADTRRMLRRYAPTAKGKPFYRAALGGPGGSRWGAFCYGRKVLVDLIELSPPHRGPCFTTRSAAYLYRYDDFPDWVDDPGIAHAFPGRLGRGDMDVARQAWIPLVLIDGGWAPDRHDHIHYPCVAVGD